MEEDNRVEFQEHDKLLFLFAHPDDDAFICGAMYELLRAGYEIHAAWLTSGGLLGGQETREHELSNAMKVLGLDESQVHLARFPDLGLTANLQEAADYLSKLVDQLEPTIVFTTAFEGGHPDHDCVNFLAYDGNRRNGTDMKIYEFPLYNGNGPYLHWKWRINSFPNDNPPSLYWPLSEEAIQVKYRIMRCYSSQWMYMAPARLVSPRSKMTHKGEPYRPCPQERDHTVRPHHGDLNYERWFNSFMKIRFDDYAGAVSQVRLSR